jgi:Leucine-rich repeat (LRR) protein
MALVIADCDYLVTSLFPAIGYTSPVLTSTNCCNGTTPFGTAPFVNCTLNQQISYLVMGGMNLNGQIPSDLSKLGALQHVDFMNNPNAKGTLDTFTSLTNLQDLYTFTKYSWLSRTSITGPIPSSISQMTSLMDLSLSGAKISGSIPKEIGQLTNLRNLDLRNTAIDGQVPAEIAQLKNLVNLRLSNTKISGSLPGDIGNLQALNVVDLSSTQISGQLPGSFSSISIVSV